MEKDPLHSLDSLGDYGVETAKMIKDRFVKGVDRGVSDAPFSEGISAGYP